MKRVSLLIALIACSASAQTTATQCFVNGQWINCTTQQRGAVDTKPTDFLSGLGYRNDQPPPSPPAVQPQDAAKADRAQIVAAMIARGECPQAIEYLRSVGDSQMLQSAITICVSTKPPR